MSIVPDKRRCCAFHVHEIARLVKLGMRKARAQCQGVDTLVTKRKRQFHTHVAVRLQVLAWVLFGAQPKQGFFAVPPVAVRTPRRVLQTRQ